MAAGSNAPRGRLIDFRYAPNSRWTCICLPQDPHKTLVREDGALLYSFQAEGAAWWFDLVIEFKVHSRHSPRHIRQWTEGSQTPIVVTELEYPHGRLQLRALAHCAASERADVVLWRFESLESTPAFPFNLRVNVHASEQVDLHFEDPSAEVAIAGAPSPHALLSTPWLLHRINHEGFIPSCAFWTEASMLESGRSLEGAFILPIDQLDGAALDLGWAHRALEEARRYWQGLGLEDLPIQVADSSIQDMLVACRRNIEQAREARDGVVEYHVGAAVYRGLWVVDGHFMLEAAQYLGDANGAREGLQGLLRRAKPSGAIEVFPYHRKETAIALATLVRQYELTGDWDLLESCWPTIMQGFRYIQRMREEARELGHSHPAYGLMPPAFGDGGLGGTRAEYTTVLWVLAGLRFAARGAIYLGRDSEADEIWNEYNDLLATFRVRAEQDMQRLPDGTPYLPMLMPGSGSHILRPDYAGEPPPWYRANPGTATWALAHAIYPGEVFAPTDPLVVNFCRLLDLVDDEEGIPAGTGWLPYRAVWNYSASFYAHVWLYAGHADKAIDYLYSFANHAAPTRVWREEQSLRSEPCEYLVGDMPHNWASAEFIRLVRHLLVFERWEDLELLPGLPEEWLSDGCTVVVRRTPTRFGPVSLQVEVEAGCWRHIAVEMDPSWHLRPRRVVLHLPTSAPPSQVRVNGHDSLVRNGTVELPIASNVAITPVDSSHNNGGAHHG